MVELTIERRERSRPPRCRAIHPFVDETTFLRLEAQAAMLNVAPEQLAAFILEKVVGDVALERRIGI